MAAAVGLQLANYAKEKRLLSKGLNHFSKRAKNKFLSKALGIGGTVAGALGFERAMVSRAPRPNQNRGGRRRAPRAGVSATTGATTVGAGNAPVAFARTDDLKASVRMIPADTDDSIYIHAVEQAKNVGCVSGTSSNQQVDEKISPTNDALFPWLSTIAKQYERYRLKFLRLHFQHYAPTNVQAEIMMQYYPDPDKAVTGLTPTQLKECSNFMTGACYEDFAHTADLSGLDPNKWYDTTADALLDDEQEFAGKCSVYGLNMDNGTASGVFFVGNFWIEAVFHLKGRQNAPVAAIASSLEKALYARDEKERRLAICLRICKKVIDDIDQRRNEVHKKDPLEELEKKFPALTLAPAASLFPTRK